VVDVEETSTEAHAQSAHFFFSQGFGVSVDELQQVLGEGFLYVAGNVVAVESMAVEDSK